jgi:hypothetical protein
MLTTRETMRGTRLLLTVAAFGAIACGGGSNTGADSGGAGGSSVSLDLLGSPYYHVADSDGAKTGSDGESALLFDQKGAVFLLVATASDAIAREGKYSYNDGQLTLHFASEDLTRHVTFRLDLEADTVEMPFKLFSEGEGTSTWAKDKEPGRLERNLFALFQAITLAQNAPPDTAIQRTVDYARAFISPESTSQSLATPGINRAAETGKGGTKAAPFDILKVEHTTNSIQTYYEVEINGVLLQYCARILLYTSATAK